MQAAKLGSLVGVMMLAASATATVQAQSAAHAARAKPLHLTNGGWTLVDLGTLGGPGSYATAVTNAPMLPI